MHHSREQQVSELINLEHDGLVLSALHDGELQAPMVMLVHGFPDTPHGWDGVVDGLLAAAMAKGLYPGLSETHCVI